MYDIFLSKIDDCAILIDNSYKIKFSNDKFKEFVKLEYVINLNLNQLLSKKIDSILFYGEMTLSFFNDRVVNAKFESVEEYFLITFRVEKKICEILTLFSYRISNGFKILSSTENIREIFGYDKEQFENLKYEDFIFPDDIEKFTLESELNILKKGTFFQRAPYRIVDSSGSIKWLYESVIFDCGIFRGILIDITKYKEFEQKVKSSTKFLESILNSSIGAVLAYKAIRNDSGSIIDFSCTLANKSAETILSIPYQKLIDKTLLESFPSIKDNLFREYCRVVEKDNTFRVESKYKKDGSIKWLDISCVKFRDGITINITDVTKRREYENSIKELNRALEEQVKCEIIKRQDLDIQYKSIFDNSFLGIFIVSLDGTILNTNKSFDDMLSYDRFELIGKNFLDITYIDDKESNLELFNSLKSASIEFYQVDKRYIKKCGDIFFTKLTVNSVKDANGEIKYLLAIVEDISEKLELERRQKEQETMLIQQSKMAQMGEMIGAIAHQWRQPLNAINILVGDMDDLFFHKELSVDEFNRISGSIKKEVEFMSHTIEDFRNFFKPSKVYKTFSLRDSIDDIKKLLKPQLDKNSIEIEIDCSSILYIRGYQNEFKQVLINIISNAKDAIESKNIHNGSIKIVAKQRELKVLLEISDNGGGIKDSMIEDIFNPYISTKGDKGTGIGLHMSRIIIENMGGRIYARNGKRGAVFIIEMEFENDEK